MLSFRKEGRKNYQLDFSVASVEIANGDCPEPLDRGLGTLLLSVMCSSRCQCGFGSDCTQGSVSFQISVIPFLNTPFSLKFVVCKFRQATVSTRLHILLSLSKITSLSS